MIKTKRSRLLVSFMGIILSAVLACNLPQHERQNQEALPPALPIQLSLGAVRSIHSQTVSPAGGLIKIDAPQSPIDGLAIEIPPGAFDQDVKFEIGFQEISDFQGGEHFNPITPLIQVDNAGVPAQQFMKVTIPIEITEDQFAMAVFYDSASREIEGMPVLDLQTGSITVATRHFSEFLVTVMNEMVLNGTVTTKFEHGVHNWQFPNTYRFSFLTPNGICAGMSLSAMYAFDNSGGAQLFDKYDNYNNPLNEETKGFFDDDTLAIRLASFAQQMQQIESSNSAVREWLRLQDASPRLTYLTFGYLMYLTEKPQLLYVENGSDQAHAVIAYKKIGNTICDRIAIITPGTVKRTCDHFSVFLLDNIQFERVLTYRAC